MKAHFCPILLIRSEKLSLAHSQEEGKMQGPKYQEMGVIRVLEVASHSAQNSWGQLCNIESSYQRIW